LICFATLLRYLFSTMNKRLFSPVILFIACNAFAQINDAGLWTSISLEKKISKRISLVASEELRFNENISELGTFFTEIGPQFKFYKGLNAGISYRFIQKRRLDDSYSVRHRINTDLSYRFKIKDFTLSLRERYQVQYGENYFTGESETANTTLRSKLSLKYRINKKWDATVFGEIFNPLFEGETYISDFRIGAGIDYQIIKPLGVEVFYLINKELNVANPTTDYVGGLGITYSF
jgi:hypothetical protein